jgi:hypothetical protein
MKIRRFLATLTAGVAVMTGAIVAPAPAQAATYWSLSNTGGDIVGAWAYGYWWWSGGRLYVQVNVKDTTNDVRGAAVRIHAYYNDGGFRSEELKANGAGNSNTYTWNFAGNVTDVYGFECTDISCRSTYGRIY